MKISELKDKTNNLLDKRSMLIAVAKSIRISFPEVRENNELQSLIKEKDLTIFEYLNNYWNSYMNFYFCAKSIIENAKHLELTGIELDKLNKYVKLKEENKQLFILELEKRRVIV